ncbi:MAG TPA: GFA family protein [Caulobacteraceae bacterium]|nr:GFA family protein [Caulobacteraceae bacterium]
MHHGSCLCGSIRFEVEGDLPGIQLCHCSQCRRASGAAFAANIPVRAADFRLVAGEPKTYASSPGKQRLFCGDCGSPIISRTSAVPDMVRVRAGLLAEPVETEAVFHFHVSSAASWLPIADDLPQYPGDRSPG